MNKSDPVASYFSIVEPDEDQTRKLKAINTYLSASEKEIKDVVLQLGTPPLSDTLFDTVFQHARINTAVNTEA